MIFVTIAINIAAGIKRLNESLPTKGMVNQGTINIANNSFAFLIYTPPITYDVIHLLLLSVLSKKNKQLPAFKLVTALIVMTNSFIIELFS
jgi:ribosomal protein L11